uniref:Primase/helicase n=1 Tax=uncultured marine virus TaxID=186617 RepID=A0A0F7LCN1_9VIRU|nr:primase/helicase [uncultured marine virus]
MRHCAAIKLSTNTRLNSFNPRPLAGDVSLSGLELDVVIISFRVLGVAYLK